MSFAKQYLTVLLDSRRVIRSVTQQTAPLKTGSISLYDREVRVLCFSFVDAAGVAIAFAAGGAFDFSVDAVRAAKAESLLMAFVDDAAINDTDDWADADPTAGKIGVRVDCATDLFAASLDLIDGEADIWCQLRMFPNGETNPCTLLIDSGFAYSNVIGRYVP